MKTELTITFWYDEEVKRAYDNLTELKELHIKKTKCLDPIRCETVGLIEKLLSKLTDAKIEIERTQEQIEEYKEVVNQRVIKV